MAQLQPQPKQQYFGDDGLPLVGGKLYTFLGGTNTPKATYSDAAGLVPNSNPIILDARGEALVFWDGTYKIVLQDALSNPIYTVDNVQITNPPYRTSATGSLITPAGTTAQRDAAPSPGYLRWNTSLSALEVWNGFTWSSSVISATAVSGPSGTPFGYRNKVVGGDCRIASIGNTAYPGGAMKYGGADNILASAANATGGTIAQVAGGAMAGICGFSQGMTALTTTAAGEVTFQTRVEAANALELANGQVALSAFAYQDTGIPLTAYLRISKANASDLFTVQTVLYTSPTAPLLSGSLTRFSFVTPVLTAADVVNGVSMDIVIVTTAAVVNKNFYITDIQLERGDTATPYEVKPYPVEKLLTGRYLPVYQGVIAGIQPIASAFAFSTSASDIFFKFDSPSRIPVTAVVVSSPAHFRIVSGAGGVGNATAIGFNQASTIGASLTVSTTVGSPTLVQGQAGRLDAQFQVSKLYFTGAQL